MPDQDPGPYQVGLNPRLLKPVKQIPSRDREAILAAIDRLAQDPRPRGCEKLTDRGDQIRLRVGDFRVIYLVDDSRRTVTVVKVGHRRDVY